MDKVQGRVALVEQFLGVGVEIDQLETLAASNTERVSQEMKRSDLTGNVKLLKVHVRRMSKHLHSSTLHLCKK